MSSNPAGTEGPTRIRFCEGCRAEIPWHATSCKRCGRVSPPPDQRLGSDEIARRKEQAGMITADLEPKRRIEPAPDPAPATRDGSVRGLRLLGAAGVVVAAVGAVVEPARAVGLVLGGTLVGLAVQGACLRVAIRSALRAREPQRR